MAWMAAGFGERIVALCMGRRLRWSWARQGAETRALMTASNAVAVVAVDGWGSEVKLVKTGVTSEAGINGPIRDR